MNTHNTGKQLTEMEQPPRKPHLEPSPKSPNHKENEKVPAMHTYDMVLRTTRLTQLLVMVALSRLPFAATASATAPLEESESANMSTMMFVLIVMFAVIGVIATLLLCCWLLVRRCRPATTRRLTPYYPNQLLYVTLTEHGKTYHSRRDCTGLARAGNVKTCKACNVCFG